MRRERSAFTFPSKPIVPMYLLIICLRVTYMFKAHLPVFAQNQSHSCQKKKNLSETSIIIFQWCCIYWGSSRVVENRGHLYLNQQGKFFVPVCSIGHIKGFWLNVTTLKHYIREDTSDNGICTCCELIWKENTLQGSSELFTMKWNLAPSRWSGCCICLLNHASLCSA